MNRHDIRLAQLLTYAGILPFLLLGIATVLKWAGYDYTVALQCYSAIIISFLCGAHWAIYVLVAEKCRQNLLFLSNIGALIAWATLLMGHHGLACGLQSFCFIYLLWLDHDLLMRHIIPAWYFKLRLNATIVVSVILISVAVMR
jgi:hypothetical protein